MTDYRTKAGMGPQVDGNHYTAMAIQPFEFSLANEWDSAAHTILKYVTRQKHGAIDLDKAMDTVRIRETLLPNGMSFRRPPQIAMSRFCAENNLSVETERVLYALDRWVKFGANRDNQEHARNVGSAILTLKTKLYG